MTDSTVRILAVDKIWDEAPHSAFTNWTRPRSTSSMVSLSC